MIKAALPTVMHHVGKPSAGYLYRLSFPVQRPESWSQPQEQSSLLTCTQSSLRQDLLG